MLREYTKKNLIKADIGFSDPPQNVEPLNEQRSIHLPSSELKQRLRTTLDYLVAVSLADSPMLSGTKQVLLDSLLLTDKLKRKKFENWLSILNTEGLQGPAGVPGIFSNNLRFKQSTEWFEGSINPTGNTALVLGGYDPLTTDFKVDKKNLIEISREVNNGSPYRRIQPLVQSLIENAMDTYRSTHYSDIIFNKDGLPEFKGLKQFSEISDDLKVRLVVKNDNENFGYVDLTVQQIKELATQKGYPKKDLLLKLLSNFSQIRPPVQGIEIKKMDSWFDRIKEEPPPIMAISLSEAIDPEENPLEKITDLRIPVRAVLYYKTEQTDKGKVLTPYSLNTSFAHAASAELPALKFLDRSISHLTYCSSENRKTNYTPLISSPNKAVPFNSVLLPEGLDNKVVALKEASFSNSGVKRLAKMIGFSELHHHLEIPDDLKNLINIDRKTVDDLNMALGFQQKSPPPSWYYLSGLLHQIPPYVIVSPENPLSPTEIEVSTYGNILRPIIDMLKERYNNSIKNGESPAEFLFSLKLLLNKPDFYSTIFSHTNQYNDEITRARNRAGSATLLAGVTGEFRDRLAVTTDEIVPDYTALLKGVYQLSDIGYFEDNFPKLSNISELEFIGANSRSADFSFSRNGKDVNVKWTLDDSPSWMEIIAKFIQQDAPINAPQIIKQIINNKDKYGKDIVKAAVDWLVSLNNRENTNIISFKKGKMSFKGIEELFSVAGKNGKVRNFAVGFSDCIVDAYVDHLEDIQKEHPFEYSSDITQLQLLATNFLERTSLDSLLTSAIFTYSLSYIHRYILMDGLIDLRRDIKLPNKPGVDFESDYRQALDIIQSPDILDLPGITQAHLIISKAVEKNIDQNALISAFSLPPTGLESWILQQLNNLNKLIEKSNQQFHNRGFG